MKINERGIKIDLFASEARTNCKYCGYGLGIQSRFYTERELIDEIIEMTHNHYKKCEHHKLSIREERLNYLLNKVYDNSKS